jgi:hypothetical protein
MWASGPNETRAAGASFISEESSKKELEGKDALLVQEEVRCMLGRYGKGAPSFSADSE